VLVSEVARKYAMTLNFTENSLKNPENSLFSLENKGKLLNFENLVGHKLSNQSKNNQKKHKKTVSMSKLL